MRGEQRMTTYKEAGVDVGLADQFVELIKPHAARTLAGFRGKMLAGIGGHAAVAKTCGAVIGLSSDGPGQKMRIAWLLDNLDGLGQDLFAMCANDLWCAMDPEESFFLDYYAVGKLSLADGERIIKSIADACCMAHTVLAGGETAEMRLVYSGGEFDLAGTIVGLARSEVSALPNRIAPGMQVWGYPSSGVHANGFGLIHRVFGLAGDDWAAGRKLCTFYNDLGTTLGEELLKPTALYTEIISRVREKHKFYIGGFAHITGGGPVRNIRRILPPDVTAIVNMNALRRAPIFDIIEREGNVKWLEMHHTFNCGMGLVAIADADFSTEGFVHMGEIKKGNLGDKGLILYSA